MKTWAQNQLQERKWSQRETLESLDVAIKSIAYELETLELRIAGMKTALDVLRRTREKAAKQS